MLCERGVGVVTDYLGLRSVSKPAQPGCNKILGPGYIAVYWEIDTGTFYNGTGLYMELPCETEPSSGSYRLCQECARGYGLIW